MDKVILYTECIGLKVVDMTLGCTVGCEQDFKMYSVVMTVVNKTTPGLYIYWVVMTVVNKTPGLYIYWVRSSHKFMFRYNLPATSAYEYK